MNTKRMQELAGILSNSLQEDELEEGASVAVKPPFNVWKITIGGSGDPLYIIRLHDSSGGRVTAEQVITGFMSETTGRLKNLQIPNQSEGEGGFISSNTYIQAIVRAARVGLKSVLSVEKVYSSDSCKEAQAKGQELMRELGALNKNCGKCARTQSSSVDKVQPAI